MYDTIIIGGGVCGFSAAMYAGRLGLKTLVFSGDVLGGVITTTNIVENWPGIKKITGEDLAMQIIEHAKEYSIEVKDEWVNEVKQDSGKGCFKAVASEDSYETKTVIFATGAKHRKHPAKNADRLENKGVHYCALCDGPLYSGKELAVIGGGDSAAKEALLLTEYSPKVHLLVRKDKLRGEPVNNERVEKNKKIILRTGTVVKEMVGENKLEAMVLEKNGKRETLKVDGVFVAIGIIPQSELAQGLGVKLNDKKEIIINRKSETSIRGVFACGDVTDRRFKQAITGSGDAVTAAYWAFELVNSSDYVCPTGGEKP